MLPQITLFKLLLRLLGTNQSTRTSFFFWQGAGRLALEMALPAAVEIRLWGGFLASNQDALSELESGDAYNGKAGAVRLVTGSRAEGFVLEEHWGQEWADQDNMWIYGGAWGVTLDNCNSNDTFTRNTCPNDCKWDFQERIQNLLQCCLSSKGNLSNPHLVLDKTNCPSGYSRLRVEGDPEELAKRMQNMNKWFQKSGPNAARECFEKRDNNFWLSSHKALRMIEHVNDKDEETIHGPAHTVGILNIEYVTALVADQPFPCMKEYRTRVTGKCWPKPDTVDRMCRLPGLVVPTGHQLSSPEERALQWRYSWSPSEVLLSYDIPNWAKQGYWAFKYTVRKTLTECPIQQLDGRSGVRSYMLKTCLLFQLEEEQTWRQTCPFRMYHLLLRRLLSYLHNRFLPHYFMPKSNLLENIPAGALCGPISCICRILYEPLTAIVLCPLEPQEVYGDLDPENILQALNMFLCAGDVSGRKQGWARLAQVVDQLDRHRKRMFKTQRWRDAPCRTVPHVRGRPSLARLKNFLDDIPMWHMYISCWRDSCNAYSN